MTSVAMRDARFEDEAEVDESADSASGLLTISGNGSSFLPSAVNNDGKMEARFFS